MGIEHLLLISAIGLVVWQGVVLVVDYNRRPKSDRRGSYPYVDKDHWYHGGGGPGAV